jgi:hypothetical protein
MVIASALLIGRQASPAAYGPYCESGLFWKAGPERLGWNKELLIEKQSLVQSLINVDSSSLEARNQFPLGLLIFLPGMEITFQKWRPSVYVGRGPHKGRFKEGLSSPPSSSL